MEALALAGELRGVAVADEAAHALGVVGVEVAVDDGGAVGRRDTRWLFLDEREGGAARVLSKYEKEGGDVNGVGGIAGALSLPVLHDDGRRRRPIVLKHLVEEDVEVSRTLGEVVPAGVNPKRQATHFTEPVFQTFCHSPKAVALP